MRTSRNRTTGSFAYTRIDATSARVRARTSCQAPSPSEPDPRVTDAGLSSSLPSRVQPDARHRTRYSPVPLKLALTTRSWTASEPANEGAVQSIATATAGTTTDESGL